MHMIHSYQVDAKDATEPQYSPQALQVCRLCTTKYIKSHHITARRSRWSWQLYQNGCGPLKGLLGFCKWNPLLLYLEAWLKQQMASILSSITALECLWVRTGHSCMWKCRGEPTSGVAESSLSLCLHGTPFCSAVFCTICFAMTFMTL